MIEQALETAGLMLGTDKSRGYCLEMICADFLAGVSLEGCETTTLPTALNRLFTLLSHLLNDSNSWMACQDLRDCDSAKAS